VWTFAPRKFRSFRGAKGDTGAAVRGRKPSTSWGPNSSCSGMVPLVRSSQPPLQRRPGSYLLIDFDENLRRKRHSVPGCPAACKQVGRPTRCAAQRDHHVGIKDDGQTRRRRARWLNLRHGLARIILSTSSTVPPRSSIACLVFFLKLLEFLPRILLRRRRCLYVLDHRIARPARLILNDGALTLANPGQERLHRSSQLTD
jgi:hypothetical protein